MFWSCMDCACLAQRFGWQLFKGILPLVHSLASNLRLPRASVYYVKRWLKQPYTAHLEASGRFVKLSRSSREQAHPRTL